MSAAVAVEGTEKNPDAHRKIGVGTVAAADIAANPSGRYIEAALATGVQVKLCDQNTTDIPAAAAENSAHRMPAVECSEVRKENLPPATELLQALVEQSSKTADWIVKLRPVPSAMPDR